MSNTQQIGMCRPGFGFARGSTACEVEIGGTTGVVFTIDPIFD